MISTFSFNERARTDNEKYVLHNRFTYTYSLSVRIPLNRSKTVWNITHMLYIPPIKIKLMNFHFQMRNVTNILVAEAIHFGEKMHLRRFRISFILFRLIYIGLDRNNFFVT